MHIDSDSDVTGKRSVLVESRHADVKEPAILSVPTPEPVFHPESFALIKRLCVGHKTSLQVIWVDAFCPADAEFFLHGTPREIQPGLVEVCKKLVRAGHPDEYRCSVCDQAKTLFALLKPLL